MGHHFVPQRHLRKFQDQAKPGYIWSFDKASQNVALLPIKQVAQSPAFYDPAIEVTLNVQVEKPGGAVIDKILRGEPLDSRTDRAHLAYHLATMIRRVPAARAAAEKLMPNVLAEVANETREWLLAAASEGLIEQDRVAGYMEEIDRAEQKFLREPPPEVRAHITTPWPFASMLAAIDRMYWRLLKTDGPSYFLTSDNPAVYFQGMGLGHPECELTMPLASNLILHCSYQGCDEMRVEEVHQLLVKEFNRRTAVGAHRFVFYHREVDWVFEAARNPVAKLNRIHFQSTRQPLWG